MIKNIFFDLDGTIIENDDENALSYKDALKKLGYDENDYKKVYDEVDEYEKTLTEENSLWNRVELLDFINKRLDKNYSIKLIDELIDSVGTYWTKNVLISEDILEKISKKYNLYIYTNFFKEGQEKRLEIIGYRKYFKKIFASDEYGSKPYKNSFEKVLKEINANAYECIMIGDNKNTDILAANNVGMKSILLDSNGKKDRKDINLNNYIVINNYENLIEILSNL